MNAYAALHDEFRRLPSVNPLAEVPKCSIHTLSSVLQKAGFQRKGHFPFCPCYPTLSGHYSRDWSESVNVIGVISEPLACEFRWSIVNIRVIV